MWQGPTCCGEVKLIKQLLSFWIYKCQKCGKIFRICTHCGKNIDEGIKYE